MTPISDHSEEPAPAWNPTIEELIQRLTFTQEAVQLDPVPLLERVKVLALLKQAEALERIAAALKDWRGAMKPGYWCIYCSSPVNSTGICCYCTQPPTNASEFHHPFQGSAKFCIQCGGGRLHEVHRRPRGTS